eukprot:2114873-Prymnesium_polylepis.1
MARWQRGGQPVQGPIWGRPGRGGLVVVVPLALLGRRDDVAMAHGAVWMCGTRPHDGADFADAVRGCSCFAWGCAVTLTAANWVSPTPDLARPRRERGCCGARQCDTEVGSSEQ